MKRLFCLTVPMMMNIFPMQLGLAALALLVGAAVSGATNFNITGGPVGGAACEGGAGCDEVDDATSVLLSGELGKQGKLAAAPEPGQEVAPGLKLLQVRNGAAISISKAPLAANTLVYPSTPSTLRQPTSYFCIRRTELPKSFANC
jgi:hypothetical protein